MTSQCDVTRRTGLLMKTFKVAALSLATIASLSACSSGSDVKNGAANGSVATVAVCDGSTELDVSYQGDMAKSALSLDNVQHSANCVNHKAVAMPKKITETTAIVVNRAANKEIRRRCLGKNMLYTLPYSVNGVSGAATTSTVDMRCSANAALHIR